MFQYHHTDLIKYIYAIQSNIKYINNETANIKCYSNENEMDIASLQICNYIIMVYFFLQNLPDTWNKAGHFFDLPDFLTWRSTGSLSRYYNVFVVC